MSLRLKGCASNLVQMTAGAIYFQSESISEGLFQSHMRVCCIWKTNRGLSVIGELGLENQYRFSMTLRSRGAICKQYVNVP